MPKIRKWQKIKSEIVYKKYGRGVKKVIFKMPDGGKSDFYVNIQDNPVCVLALTKDKKVISARQFRPGPNKILDELPGGYIEPGEAPTKAMARELLEETGYRGKLKMIGRSFECAYSTVHRYCFVATDCVKISEPRPEAGEQTEVVLYSLPNFRKLLRSGEVTDAEVGYFGLDYLKLL